MNRFLLPLVLAALALLLWRAFPEREAADDPLPVQRSVECRWAAGRIIIDGKINEKSWEDAVEVKDFVVFWQKRKAKTTTKARLMWDDRYLYFAAEMEDADLYGTIKEKNGMTWNNDVFELFFKPGGEGVKKHRYYEFQVNVLNTQLELFLPSRGAGGYQRFGSETNLGMESAVHIKGTLNDWKDSDEGWIVEGKIPWKAFDAVGGKPQEGAKWRFALCRYDYSVAFEATELSSTAPLTSPNFHQYEDYGELVFVVPK